MINKMKKLTSKLIVSILPIITWWLTACFADDMSWDIYYIWDSQAVSWINLPWLTSYDWDWWSDALLIMLKTLFNRAIEYLPMLVLVLLLLACVKIIFEWDWKAWFKRIKYILIWVALMILSIYVMNIVSTIISWHPLINIHLNRWY